MAKSSMTPAQHPQDNPKVLRSTITDMDCLAQNAFTEIASIAKLALYSLEVTGGRNDVEALAGAFNAIWEKAVDAENNINSEAERVGCDYTDERFMRRLAAASARRLSDATGSPLINQAELASSVASHSI